MKKGGIIVGISILIITSIYVTQYLENEQINEIAEVDEERISKCDISIDKDRNNIPDELENRVYGEGITFSDKNWSHCTFASNILNYQFIDSNFSNMNFLNSEISNSLFFNVNLDESNFSNSSLYGNIFLNTSIKQVNFTNADFYPNPWVNPFIIFTMDNSPPNFTCYFDSCELQTADCVGCGDQNRNDWIYKLGDMESLNLRIIDIINDKSDRREVYRHITGFYDSEIDQTFFKNADLSHVVFSNTRIVNSTIESSNIVDILFDSTELKNTKINEKHFKEGRINGLMDFENDFKQKIYNEINKKSQTNDYEMILNIVDGIDEIPVNWAMGMTIFEDKLYVAETDDHRISTYDINTLNKESEFSSPLSHYCESTNTWNKKNADCPNDIRNLPTSIVILNQKIFVSYGFKDEIQEFNLNGEFLSKFGNTGNEKGEFNNPYKIAASEEFLYVADSGNKRIQIFDSNKEHVNQIRIAVPNQSEVNLDVEIYEDKIFVINNKTPHLMIFDLNGNIIDEILLEQKKGYSSISIENGIIAVTNSDENTISIFDMKGTLMGKSGTLGKYYGEFNNPKEIIMNNNKIYVSDVYNYRIQVFEIEKR